MAVAKGLETARTWRGAWIRALSAGLIVLTAAATPHSAPIATSSPAANVQSATVAASRHAAAGLASAGARRPARFGEWPLLLEVNIGQAPAPIRYVARGDGYTVGLLASGLMLDLRYAGSQQLAVSERHPSGAQPSVGRALLRLDLVGARPQPSLRAELPQSSVSNYFIGNDPSNWHRNVANYRALRYEQVYPGIDWLIHGKARLLEYDFVVAPHIDPGQIKLEVDGADLLAVADNGDLLIKAHGQTLRQLKPRIYQLSAEGKERDLEGRYIVKRNLVGFEVGPYDRSQPLVIDPVFVYSTYLGGSGYNGDSANAIAVDGSGNAYIAGATSSTNFPTANPFQAANDDRVALQFNAFVTKLNSDGSALIYSTYLGGSGDISFNGDGANAIAVDSAGNVYVAGYTSSSDFPTANPFQAANKASASSRVGSNAFVTKLDAAGSALVYSTFLGGSGTDSANAVAVDGSGNAYLAGNTSSHDFPTANPIQAVNNVASADISTVFITKLTADGSALVYSTYLGGSGTNSNGGVTTVGGDIARGIALDPSGNAYVVGVTFSTDFPTANALQNANNDSSSAFVTKINSAGSALVYSTYLGGSSNSDFATYAEAVALDSAGNAYVAGVTDATDFPTVNPLQGTNKGRGGASTAFVSKLNVSGNALIYSTYLGGSGGDSANAIAVDGSDQAYVAGSTASVDFPVNDALQSSNNGAPHNASNAFVSVLNAAGSTLEFSSYLGGSGTLSKIQPDCVPCAPIYSGDGASAVAVDQAGNVYLAGSAFSTDFPTFAPFQAMNRAAGVYESNAFATKIEMQSGPGGTAGGTGGSGSVGWDLMVGLALALCHRLRQACVGRDVTSLAAGGD